MAAFIPAEFEPLLTHLKGYGPEAGQTAFLLGGIGTGNISVGVRGQLQDWEVFNRPGKDNKFPYTFFALHVHQGDKKHTRVLEGPLQPPFAASHGIDSSEVAGLPRFSHSEFKGEYPLVKVRLWDESLPVHATLEAYTPFIPLNPDDSGIPAAVIRYRVKNESTEPAFVAVAGSIANMTTFNGYGCFNYVEYAGESKNVPIREEGLSGIRFESCGFAPYHPMHASMALASTGAHVTVKPYWYQGGWWDGIQDFWDDFSQDGRLEAGNQDEGDNNSILNLKKQKIGSVVSENMLAPGETCVFEFLLSWHFPNRIRSWNQCYDPENVDEKDIVRNHYALKYNNAWEAARDLQKRLPALEEKTFAFHKALFDSTLPTAILDAVSSNITVLRSNTCFWLEDGTFWGWEGCFNQAGCCDGNCTHVWNYAQTIAFLFPTLEIAMRRNEFLTETDEKGKMNFRARKHFEDEEWTLYPAADGQTGAIVRLFREWKFTGDNSLIDDMGEAAIRALDFSIAHWDSDGDGVLDSQQHNTYDIEFYGLSSMTNTVFFAALKAGAQIADYLQLPEHRDRYLALYEKGSRRMDEALWNGEYYNQKIADLNEHKYQYGEGCLSDQLLGQFMAHVSGLHHILPPEHVKKAVKAIHAYNFRRDFFSHESVQRTYALNDEQGLLLCSWPKGGRPKFPFVYSDEVWSGIEYQVAATLIYEGLVEEGMEIVTAVRARHDGIRRNPFNEVECGHHYARSMASWALLTALSGFYCDETRGEVTFSPRISQENFRCFYSTGKEWGVYRQWKDEKGEMRKEKQTLYRV